MRVKISSFLRETNLNYWQSYVPSMVRNSYTYQYSRNTSDISYFRRLSTFIKRNEVKLLAFLCTLSVKKIGVGLLVIRNIKIINKIGHIFQILCRRLGTVICINIQENIKDIS